MFQIFICLPIGQSLIAQILDFMLVRTSTSLQKHGILRIPTTKFEKVSSTNLVLSRHRRDSLMKFFEWKIKILGMDMVLKNQQFGIVDIPLLKILSWFL